MTEPTAAQSSDHPDISHDDLSFGPAHALYRNRRKAIEDVITLTRGGDYSAYDTILLSHYLLTGEFMESGDVIEDGTDEVRHYGDLPDAMTVLDEVRRVQSDHAPPWHGFDFPSVASGLLQFAPTPKNIELAREWARTQAATLANLEENADAGSTPLLPDPKAGEPGGPPVSRDADDEDQQ